MWEKFAPTHRSRDMAAHAQWLQTANALSMVTYGRCQNS